MNPVKKKIKRAGPKFDHHLVLEDIPKYFILLSLTFLIIAVFWIIWPFIPALIIGAVIATGFHPIHKWILKRLKRRTPASVISTLIILLVILIPVSWFIVYITEEAFNIYGAVEGEVAKIDINLLPEVIKNSTIGNYIDKYKDIVPIQLEDVIGYAATLVQNASQFIVNQTTSFARSLSVLAVHLFVFLISIYFFLRDGDKVIEAFKGVLPLPKKYRKDLVSKLQDMSHGVLYGIFGAAAAQGLLGGIGFALAGIGNAGFWGTVMAFFAIVPYVGSTLIWIPAAIILFITGHWVAGLFLVLWGIFIIGTIDNFIKPIIIGERAHIHPLLSFLTILGGLFTMGLPGIIIAPYLLSLTLSFLFIYKQEYQTVLDHD